MTEINETVLLFVGVCLGIILGFYLIVIFFAYIVSKISDRKVYKIMGIKKK